MMALQCYAEMEACGLGVSTRELYRAMSIIADRKTYITFWYANRLKRPINLDDVNQRRAVVQAMCGSNPDRSVA